MEAVNLILVLVSIISISVIAGACFVHHTREKFNFKQEREKAETVMHVARREVEMMKKQKEEIEKSFYQINNEVQAQGRMVNELKYGQEREFRNFMNFLTVKKESA